MCKRGPVIQSISYSWWWGLHLLNLVNIVVDRHHNKSNFALYFQMRQSREVPSEFYLRLDSPRDALLLYTPKGLDQLFYAIASLIIVISWVTTISFRAMWNRLLSLFPSHRHDIGGAINEGLTASTYESRVANVPCIVLWLVPYSNPSWNLPEITQVTTIYEYKL